MLPDLFQVSGKVFGQRKNIFAGHNNKPLLLAYPRSYRGR
jgi:hypothetical protein